MTGKDKAMVSDKNAIIHDNGLSKKIVDGTKPEVDLSKPETIATEKEKMPSLRYRIVKTIMLVTIWIAFGLFLEITGPTLLDLKLRAHINYEAIARAVSGRSFGEFSGAVIGGFLVDKFSTYVDMVIAVWLALAGAATFSIPWAPKIELVWFFVVIQGLADVIINVAANRTILQMWREKATSPMHLLHMGFGIGSFIVPLIANPFLAVTADNSAFNCSNATQIVRSTEVEDLHVSHNTTNAALNCSSNFTTGTESDDSSVRIIKESSIQYAYGIVAIPPLCLAIVFFFYQFMWNRTVEQKKNSPTQAEKGSFKRKLDIINPATCAGGNFCYGLQIFVLMFLFFFCAIGGERLCSKFLRAFAIDNYHFTKDEGSYINTAFWISFSAGRFAGFAVGRWVPIRILLLIEIIGLFISTLILNIFGTTNSTVFWIFIQPVGFFTAQLFPTGMSWTDYHVELTGTGIMCNCLGGGLGGVSFLWIIGYFYERNGPLSFLYELMGFAVFTCVLGFALHFIGVAHGSRFANDKKEAETIVEYVKTTDAFVSTKL